MLKYIEPEHIDLDASSSYHIEEFKSHHAEHSLIASGIGTACGSYKVLHHLMSKIMVISIILKIRLMIRSLQVKTNC